MCLSALWLEWAKQLAGQGCCSAELTVTGAEVLLTQRVVTAADWT